MNLSTLLWAICGLGVAGAFLWCLLVLPGTPEAFPTGDGAVLELYTLVASRGWWEYGPYSRWGWHHPGPLFFYLLVPFYKAAHAHSLAINAGPVALNLIAVTVLLWAIARHASATLAVAVTASIAVYLWRMPPLIVSAWNPHTVLLPLAALIVTASITAAGRLSLLPVTIVLASFITQTHIAVLSSAAVAVSCALVAGVTTAIWRRAPGRSPWFWLGVSALIGIILWLPPIVEQLTHDDGNLSKIARFFLTPNPGDPGEPYMPALRVWAKALLVPLSPDLYFPVGSRMAVRGGMEVVKLAQISVVLLLVAGWGTARGAVDAWLCRICALLSIVALPAIMRAQGGLGDYMVIWITTIGVINAAALAAWFAWLLAKGFGLASAAAFGAAGAQRISNLRSNLRVRWIVPAVTCVCLIGATTQGALELERLRAERNAARNGDRVRGESVYGALRGFLARAHVRRPLIRVVGTWDNAAAIVLQLHKRHQPVAVDDDSLWLIGPNFAKDGTEDADMALAERSERHRVASRDGDCMLIERHGLSLHVLRQSLRTPIELTCE